MSMNEFRSAFRSKIYVVVMNIFAQLTHLITYGSGALNTISCEVLWTGEERAGQTTLHSVRIRQWAHEYLHLR